MFNNRICIFVIRILNQLTKRFLRGAWLDAATITVLEQFQQLKYIR